MQNNPGKKNCSKNQNKKNCDRPTENESKNQKAPYES